MKKLTALALSLPFIVSGAAFADDRHDHDMSPAEMHHAMCTDRYAHMYGKTAYLQAKLGITDKQQAAWDAWQKAELDSATRERDACLAEQPKDKADSIVEQEARLETMLQGKLDELHASRPALETLYAQLTDEQKDELNASGEWHHRPHGMEMPQHDMHDGSMKPDGR